MRPASKRGSLAFNVCPSCIPILCLIVLRVPSLLSLPVLVELQQSGLITSKECKRIYKPSNVVRVQSGKSPEVQTKTADVLRRHGFGEESNLLAGKKTHLRAAPHPCTCGVLYSGA